jgi:hypothetical protein
MTIRTFAPGDDLAQVGVYNDAAAELPKFKPATLDEVRRRQRGGDFNAATNFFALEGGRPVGYIHYQSSGRLSFPWCRRGHESHAAPLLEYALNAMRKDGVKEAFAAYRTDWPAQRDFFVAHGFRATREVINFVMDLNELPTPAARAASTIAPLTPTDLADVVDLAPGVLRVRDAAALDKHLFHNDYFPSDAAFALRSRVNNKAVAVGLIVADESYADPKQVDAFMPCFRLGAFGSEGLGVKRLKGLFSFVAAPGNDVNPLALDLLNHAAFRLESTDIGTLCAQVASDAVHLVRFYKQYFRRQGSFSLYEMSL